MIKFIKILKYPLRPNKGDVFNYLSLITSQKLDPPSLAPRKLDIKGVGLVLYSSLRRAEECLKKKRGVKYLKTPLLREVPFNLKKLCDKEEWGKQGSSIVRRKFKEAFIKDRLLIKRGQIFKEIEKVLKICLEKSKHQNIAVVSHSFRLKVIEAFIRTQGKIKDEPALINKFILDSQKTFEFGKGFKIKRGELSFLFDKHQ